MNSLVAAYRESLRQQGVDDPTPDYDLMRGYLSTLATDDPQILTKYPDFAEQYREIRLANAPSTMVGIANTARTAYDRTQQGFNAIGGTVDADDVARLERDIQARPSSVPWEDWQRSEGAEARKAFLRDPIEITANIIASGFAGSLPALTGGLAGGGAGFAVGGPVGGAVGAAIGTGAGSTATEYGAKYLDVLREVGADLTDPDSIRRVLEDPETRLKARGLAWRRSIPVGVFDAASAGLAGKLVKGFTAATTAGKVGRVAAEGGFGGAMGGLGEVAGAVSAGEEIKPGAIFEEVIGDVVPQLAQAGAASLRNRTREQPTIVPPVPPAGTPGAIPATPASVLPPVATPTPLAPVAPVARTNAQIVAAVDAMDDATAAARLAELLQKAQRLPEEEAELDYLKAVVRPPAVAPPSVAAVPTTPAPAPTVAPILPPVATEPPVVAPAPGIAVAPPAVAAMATPVDIGPRDAGISTGTGVPTPYEAQMMADWQQQIAAGSVPVAPRVPVIAPPPVMGAPTSIGLPGQEIETPDPIAPAPAPLPVAPKIAAPAVAAQTDLPKPSEIPPALPSTALAPAEHAAIVATQAKAAPLPYGAIVTGDATIDMRGWAKTRPATVVKAIWEHLAKPYVQRSDKGGAKGKTRLAMLLQSPGSSEVILAGVTAPAKLQRVSGGNQFVQAVAIQRMGADKKKRRIEVGGSEPVLLADLLDAGYKPMAFISFDGEPTTIFNRYATAEEAFAPLDATAKRELELGRSGPNLRGDVRSAVLTEAQLNAEIDQLGSAWLLAEKNKDEAEMARLQAAMVALYDRQQEVTRTGQSQTGDVSSARGNVGPSGIDPTAPNAHRFRNAKPNEITESDRQVLADMGVSFSKKLGRHVVFTAVEPDAAGSYRGPGGSGSRVQPLHADNPAAVNVVPREVRLAGLRGGLQQALGTRIIFFDTSIPIQSWGLHSELSPNTLLVNASSPTTFSAVVGHELGHDMELRRRDLYDTLSRLVLDVAPMRQSYAAVRRAQGYATADLQREYVNDVIGDRFSEPAFWDALGRRAREMGVGDKFRQLLDWVIQWLGLRSSNPDLRGDLSLETRANRLPEIERLREVVAQAVIEFTQSQTEDAAFQTEKAASRAPIEAQRMQQFIAVVERLRRQGANVETFTQEFFRQGVRAEVEAQIAQLRARQNGAPDAVSRALAREIFRRESRLAEVDQARGATFSPWHISLAVDDIQNATMGNLVTLLHEASEALTMRLNPAMKGRVAHAIQASLTEIRAQTAAAAARNQQSPARESGLFDVLAENLAQRLAADGIPDGPGLAQAIWRWVRDLYYRAAMAAQRAFGAEPSAELALDWYENQLRRVVGGDYDYRLASLLDRYLPEPMMERVRRYPGRTGTPGGVSDYWNPYTGTMQQPSVLPNTPEAVGWNLEFQTVGTQRTQNGEEIAGPEARARIDYAALSRFADQAEGVRVASGSDLAWAEWWATVGGTAGDDPKVMMAALAAQLPGVETAAIDGPRMNATMNGLAGVEARRLAENLQAKARNAAATANEQIESESDSVVEASKAVNRMEADRRSAELHEASLRDKLKKMVRRFVRDTDAGMRLAEQKGELAEAVRQAEGLLDRDPIPDAYQQVFKAILDGDVSVFDYVRAIARLDLPISDLTQRELVKAVRDSADTNETLKALTRNRPLLTALTALARANAGHVDEIALGWIPNAQQYAAIHDELQAIRAATDDQLTAMLATMDDRVESATLRDRLKRDYLRRRRDLRTARNRVARAQARVDTIAAALPRIDEAVERSQQSGSQAPSEWVPTPGAEFTEMVLGDDGGWSSRRHTLVYGRDGRLENGDAYARAIAANNLWLKANESKRGGATWERIQRQTTQLKMVDASGQYQNAQTAKLATFITPMVAEARRLGATGAQVAQMMQFFEHIRFVHQDKVGDNAAAWEHAFIATQNSAGMPDNGQFVDAVYDPVSYFLNTEPGLDEEAAIRQAIRVARARLPKPPDERFNGALESLLRASKTGFELLMRVANENGVFVNDPKLKSQLRNAVARGWLTSMRSMDGGVVNRILVDMQKAGWKVALETENDSRGNPQTKIVEAVTFRDLTSAETANADALRPALQQLFTPGILRDWLVPFINKGGVEVFKHGDRAIPQLTLQNAWARAGGDVLAWIDAVGAEVGLPVPDEDNPNPVADFRLSMLRQFDGLFGMESKMAADISQVKNMFDPMGPKPHVMMDARVNDLLPPEHLRFALLDRHTSQMLLAEIAFHAAFGRNGQRMVQTLTDLTRKADGARVEYNGLTATTRNGRVAEALVRGWDYKELENAAAMADQVRSFQSKIETFMSIGNKGGPFDDVRAWMTFLNFMTGQIVDNPKTALYNLLSLAQTPFAMRSLGPATLRTVSDAFVTAAKSGLGSLLDAMHIHLMNASGFEAEVAGTMGQSRNQPWSHVFSDVGAGGRQTLLDKILVRPVQMVRYIQNKGVGLPFQGSGTNPRLAVIPGGGVSNFIAKTAAVGGMSAQARMLERMVSNGIAYFAAHRDAAQDPTFRFKARDLGLGRWDQGAFDWWRAKAPEYQLGTLEDVVRASLPRAAAGERLLSRDQVLKVGQMVSTEVNGDTSVNTMPSLLVQNPFLRGVFPLLRWPFWAMHATHEGLRTVDGKRNYAQFAKGLGILAMWNLPLGLAFTFLLDRYDDELLGKKSNLPATGAVAALPFVGPVLEALTADRSIPDTLVAYGVRMGRAGNIYGVGSDLVGQMMSPTDAQSGRRVFSLDQRVLVMSQLLNMQQAVSNAVAQDWTTTWSSFWSPLFRSVGGNASLHILDVVNNALGLDNAEARQVARTNASNWLRASAAELDIELRSGGAGVPTPMSVHTRSMLESAMANDRISFLENYRRALEAARKTVASDPSVNPMDREREAESRVRAGWRGRNPLSIFARSPTPIELRRLLSIMDDGGKEAVTNALQRYDAFSRLISVSPQQAQQRALERRLTRPAGLQNPYRLAQPAFRY